MNMTRLFLRKVAKIFTLSILVLYHVRSSISKSIFWDDFSEEGMHDLIKVAQSELRVYIYPLPNDIFIPPPQKKRMHLSHFNAEVLFSSFSKKDSAKF